MKIKYLVYDLGNTAKIMRSGFRSGFEYSNNDIQRRVLILANGPSAKEYLSEIRPQDNLDFFCLNDFACSPFFTVICPRFYILYDPCYWIERDKTNDYDVVMREKVIDSFLKNVSWDMTLFVPFEALKYDFPMRLQENSNIKLKPFNGSYLSMIDTKLFFYYLDKNYGTPFNNVLAAAIYLSINMGYKTIGMLGSDHSWTKDIRVNMNNEVCTVKRHFYDDNEELVPWKTSLGVQYSVSGILEDLRRTFYSYEVLSKYAKRHKTMVVNFSVNSFIDAFEKRKFELSNF